MKTGCIRLSDAVFGREYIIDHIKKEKQTVNNLIGYGISSGSKIKLLFTAPTGEPYAYEIMGTVLAIRHEDSNNIIVYSEVFNE